MDDEDDYTIPYLVEQRKRRDWVAVGIVYAPTEDEAERAADSLEGLVDVTPIRVRPLPRYDFLFDEE